jgi:hypothetical protein
MAASTAGGQGVEAAAITDGKDGEGVGAAGTTDGAGGRSSSHQLKSKGMSLYSKWKWNVSISLWRLYKYNVNLYHARLHPVAGVGDYLGQSMYALKYCLGTGFSQNQLRTTTSRIVFKEFCNLEMFFFSNCEKIGLDARQV